MLGGRAKHNLEYAMEAATLKLKQDLQILVTDAEELLKATACCPRYPAERASVWAEMTSRPDQRI